MNAKTARALLIEIGCEELPPASLQKLARAFADALVNELREAGMLKSELPQYACFATPRRLAVRVSQVLPVQPDRIEHRRGPQAGAAYDAAGAPTAALLGFARNCGVRAERLKTQKIGEREWIVFEQKVRGKKLAAVLGECLPAVMKKLPIAKRMRWGEGDAEFVRPVHWLAALHGDARVNLTLFGLRAGRVTFGHRFHAPKSIHLASARAYEGALKKSGMVLADFDLRREKIRAQIERLAKTARAKSAIDADLLDQVTALVEWPQALVGAFDERFLKLPAEILVSCMRDHQRYFHLLNARGNLLPKFIVVCNIKSSAPARVRAGNERVLRARLSDAEFFYSNDIKAGLDAYASRLDGLLFHGKLGAVSDKVERIAILAAHIAEETCDQTPAKESGEAKDLARAAQLCKADLLSDIVGEFPELQGVAGRCYALAQGESRAVADAIEQHYYPRFAGDRLPETAIARSLALADRIDTLVGIFAAGEPPSGDKDPYALRRAAFGVARILIEQQWDLDLRALFARALPLFTDKKPVRELDADAGAQASAYVMQRLRAYYRDAFPADAINAVMATGGAAPLDFARRLHALHDFFRGDAEAAHALAAANKRIANILDKNAAPVTRFDPRAATEPAETRLAEVFGECRRQVERDFQVGDYAAGLKRLAALRAPIDDFFDRVMVMHEDAATRANRLALLSEIRALFLACADISQMRGDA